MFFHGMILFKCIKNDHKIQDMWAEDVYRYPFITLKLHEECCFLFKNVHDCDTDFIHLTVTYCHLLAILISHSKYLFSFKLFWISVFNVLYLKYENIMHL